MDIKTKFDVGQDIWFMSDNQPQKAEITKISIDVTQNPYVVTGVVILYHYGLYIDHIINETKCYGSRKELVESLLSD